MHNTTSLKLYAFGVGLLHDPNWTGMELYDRLKQHVRGRVEPTILLFKTIKKGLLFHLGECIYEEYLEDESRFENYLGIRGEYLIWYLEDFLNFLYELKISKSESLVYRTQETLDEIFGLYENNEDLYWEKIDISGEKLVKLAISLSNEFRNEIIHAKNEYSQDFAERVFHDRTLCEFISKLIIEIGFGGKIDEDDKPTQWIKRVSMPQWAIRAVISRDRGKCALCEKNIVIELEANYHIDHIIPLAEAGTNDLSNLQLLCENCNLSKSKKIISVKSSIPKYLQLKLEKRDFG